MHDRVQRPNKQQDRCYCRCETENVLVFEEAGWSTGPQPKVTNDRQSAEEADDTQRRARKVDEVNAVKHVREEPAARCDTPEHSRLVKRLGWIN